MNRTDENQVDEQNCGNDNQRCETDFDKEMNRSESNSELDDDLIEFAASQGYVINIDLMGNIQGLSNSNHENANFTSNHQPLYRSSISQHSGQLIAMESNPSNVYNESNFEQSVPGRFPNAVQNSALLTNDNQYINIYDTQLGLNAHNNKNLTQDLRSYENYLHHTIHAKDNQTLNSTTAGGMISHLSMNEFETPIACPSLRNRTKNKNDKSLLKRNQPQESVIRERSNYIPYKKNEPSRMEESEMNTKILSNIKMDMNSFQRFGMKDEQNRMDDEMTAKSVSIHKRGSDNIRLPKMNQQLKRFRETIPKNGILGHLGNPTYTFAFADPQSDQNLKPRNTPVLNNIHTAPMQDRSPHNEDKKESNNLKDIWQDFTPTTEQKCQFNENVSFRAEDESAAKGISLHKTSQEAEVNSVDVRAVAGCSGSSEKNCICPVCGKCFDSSSKLKRHSVVHSGEKPFTCSVCKKKFNVKYNLNMHTLVHLGQKFFKCVVCQKQFTRKSNLKTHELIHSGEKQFRCNTCDSVFLLKHHLKLHILTHTTEKHFICSFCEKSYKYKKALDNHAVKCPRRK